MDIPRKAVRIVKLDNNSSTYTYLNQYSVEFMKVAQNYVIKEYRDLKEVLKATEKFLSSE